MCVQNLKLVALPILEIIWDDRQSLDMPTLPFLQFFNGLLFGWILWMYRPNWKSVSLPIPEIIRGVAKKFWGVGVGNGIVRKSVGEFPYRLYLYQYSFVLNLDSCFGWGCKPPILGKRGRRRSGMVLFERALVTSYRLSIVTFPLSLRVSEILPLLCSSTPLSHPPLISPKFPHVPLGLGLWPLGYEEQRPWANCPCS